MTESPAYSTETELSELTAFNLLYRLHVSALVNYAERFVDDGTARDLVHDVFVRIWTARRFRMPETEIRRYLFRCVLNACRDHVRHQQVENNFLSKTIAQLKLHELEYHEAHWEHAPDERQLRAVYLEIDKLPDRCREIFRRTYLDGCKSRDIAAELGISQRHGRGSAVQGAETAPPLADGNPDAGRLAGSRQANFLIFLVSMQNIGPIR